jgi:Ni,Fe-hydrogenase I large subunit
MPGGNAGAIEPGRPMPKHYLLYGSERYALAILRPLHSFDPCLACSTHVMAQDGREIGAVEVRI